MAAIEATPATTLPDALAQGLTIPLDPEIEAKIRALRSKVRAEAKALGLQIDR